MTSSITRDDLKVIKEALKPETNPITDMFYKLAGGLIIAAILYVASSIPSIQKELAVIADRDNMRTQQELRFMAFMQKPRFTLETFEDKSYPLRQGVEYNKKEILEIKEELKVLNQRIMNTDK